MGLKILGLAIHKPLLHTSDMTNTQITYNQYTAWVAARCPNTTPYSAKQWETMSDFHKFGVSLSVRRWLAA